MRAGPVNLQTLAETLGVSTTTVHRALHGTGAVSPATRRRVLEAARRLGYRPNRLARSLRQGRSLTVGVIFTTLYGPFAGRVGGMLEESLLSHSYGMVLSNSAADPQRERQLVDLLLERGVDGLIVFSSGTPQCVPYYAELLERGVPFVLVDHRLPGVPAPLVATDHLRGGYLVGRHLAAGGRRRVAFVMPVNLHERSWTSTQAKLQGCNLALTEAGAEPVQLLVPGEGSSHQAANQAVHRALEQGPDFDALFCSSDSLAGGAIRALLEAGRDLPRQVAVVGYDDEELAICLTPSLSTVRQPEAALAQQVVELLLRRLQQGESGPSSEHLYLAPELILRESSGPAADHTTPKEAGSHDPHP